MINLGFCSYEDSQNIKYDLHLKLSKAWAFIFYNDIIGKSSMMWEMSTKAHQLPKNIFNEKI